jgi:DNA recombination protein RmuC
MWRNLMLSDVLSSQVFELVTMGTLAAFILCSAVAWIIGQRQQTKMHRQLVQLRTDYLGTLASVQQLQTSTKDDLQRLHTATQDTLRQLQIAQASTQTTVTFTQQETQRFAQEVQTLHRASQALMVELKSLQTSSQAIIADWRKETAQLSRALRTNYQQGVWGEQELLQVVHLAGMTQHCDFDLKPRMANGQVPDLLVHLPNQRSIAVDAKAPSQAYLDAMQCEDEKTRITKLEAYARRVRDTMNELAKKDYWKQLQPAPALVILFLPNEAMFRAALEYDLTLLDAATQKNVMLASPITLIALLKAIAYGWSQEERAQNVERIVEQSKTLHQALDTWSRRWLPLGKALHQAITAFNQVAAEYESTIQPLLQELGSLDSTRSPKEKIVEIKSLRASVNLPEEDTRQPEEAAHVEDSSWQKQLTHHLGNVQTFITQHLFTANKEAETP